MICLSLSSSYVNAIDSLFCKDLFSWTLTSWADFKQAKLDRLSSIWRLTADEESCSLVKISACCDLWSVLNRIISFSRCSFAIATSFFFKVFLASSSSVSMLMCFSWNYWNWFKIYWLFSCKDLVWESFASNSSFIFWHFCLKLSS